MIVFGLYSGQRLGDIATLRWGNIDLQRNELRLSTRKTGKAMILPLAAPLRKHIRSLHFAGDPSAPIHPKAFDLVERQHKTGNLSNQFADLLAAAGLRERRITKTLGKVEGPGETLNRYRFTVYAGQRRQFCTRPVSLRP
jgi:integrase